MKIIMRDTYVILHVPVTAIKKKKEKGEVSFNAF